MKFIVILILANILAIFGVKNTEYPPPAVSYKASDYTKWKRKYSQSRAADINVEFTGSDGKPDYIDM